MNAQQFLTWMRNPGTTSREESAQLDAMLDSFPYFQSGHLLYIKNLHNQGSFLYNNQLKTAAAYAVNRKVLYNLITLKTGVQSASFDYALSTSSGHAQDDKQLDSQAVEQSDSQQSSSQQSDSQQSSSQQSDSQQSSSQQSDSQQSETVTTTSVVEKQEEEVSVPPKFPPRKFTSNPDEWEAGMLRQLQLLHHWQQKSGDEQPASFGYAQDDKRTAVGQSDSFDSAQDDKQPETQVPDAKEEINTLLYVLVEPGQSEDIAEDVAEEISTEAILEESESTQWEIKIAEEEKEEIETPIAVPSDLVEKQFMVEAIHSTFELEVDDTIPSVEEMKPFRLEPIEQTAAPVAEEKAAEEVVVSGMEMSFSQWLQEVSKSEGDKSEVDKSKVDKSEVGKLEVDKLEVGKSEDDKTEVTKKKSELPKTVLSTDVLVEQFIKDQPRINVKKSGFYNPVNMAKKSVQESDEFVTETLARIYAKQGNTVKAVRAYQKLSLKFPEKTAYFAALIEELKRTPNK